QDRAAPRDLERHRISELPRGALKQQPASSLRGLRAALELVMNEDPGRSVPSRQGVRVIIPVLNEEEAIGGVIGRIPHGLVDGIIVADGGSKDRTVEIAIEKGARVIKAGKGYGRACIEGALAAGDGCRAVVYMDGDGSDFPEELPKLTAPILAGTHDFVIAS